MIELTNNELLEIYGGDNEILVLAFASGYAAGRAFDFAVGFINGFVNGE